MSSSPTSCPPAAAPVRAPRPVRVLAIDDDAPMRLLLQLWLEEGLGAPFAFDGAATLAGGLEALAAQAPDVVLLDQRLPDGSGLEALPRFRAGHPDVAVVLVSGDERPGLEQEAWRRGAHAFVPKRDIGPDLLAQVVRGLCGVSRPG